MASEVIPDQSCVDICVKDDGPGGRVPEKEGSVYEQGRSILDKKPVLSFFLAYTHR